MSAQAFRPREGKDDGLNHPVGPHAWIQAGVGQHRGRVPVPPREPKLQDDLLGLPRLQVHQGTSQAVGKKGAHLEAHPVRGVPGVLQEEGVGEALPFYPRASRRDLQAQARLGEDPDPHLPARAGVPHPHHVLPGPGLRAHEEVEKPLLLHFPRKGQKGLGGLGGEGTLPSDGDGEKAPPPDLEGIRGLEGPGEGHRPKEKRPRAAHSKAGLG